MKNRTLKTLEIELKNPVYSSQEKQIIIETITLIESMENKQTHPLCYLLKNI